MLVPERRILATWNLPLLPRNIYQITTWQKKKKRGYLETARHGAYSKNMSEGKRSQYATEWMLEKCEEK